MASLQPGLAYGCRMAAVTCSDCFIDSGCFDYFLKRLLSRAPSYRVVIHAYSLLPREVILLATPHTPQGISGLLQSVAVCYGRYFQLRFDRSRRVFNNWLRCISLESPAAVIEAQRFMERIGINNHPDHCPGQHHWSSYSEFGLGGRCSPLVLHPAWQAILPSGPRSLAAYRAQLAVPIARERYRQLQLRFRTRFN